VAKWKFILFFAMLVVPSCQKTNVVLRDPVVYRNEVAFFQLALEQDTELLVAHLADGSCTCDEAGAWSSELCETTAINVLVIQIRLQWHLDMMSYLSRAIDTRPALEPPSVPEPSTLCPE
jgi:hypothetical protein